MDTDSVALINNLAGFLIVTDRNIDEGIVLADKALDNNPGNWKLLQTKGWALYKLGNYQEALNALQGSWDAKPTYYDHNLHLQIEEVKKALAGN